MPHNFQNVNLSHNSRNVCLVLDFIFFEDFDGDLLRGQLVNSFTHFAERTGTNCLTCERIAIEPSKKY